MGRMVKDRGGLYWKFVSPGTNGVPDRLVIPGAEGSTSGEVWFIEMKSPTGRLSDLQKYRGEQLVKRGCKYRVLSSRQEVIDFVREVFGG